MCRSIQDTNTSGPAQEILVLIPLASCDGSYEPKHLRSPARAFPSRIHKVWYQSGSAQEILVTSLSICTVSLVPLHFAYTKYGIQATNTRGPAQRDSGTHRISEQRWLMRMALCNPARAFASCMHKVWK